MPIVSGSVLARAGTPIHEAHASQVPHTAGETPTVTLRRSGDGVDSADVSTRAQAWQDSQAAANAHSRLVEREGAPLAPLKEDDRRRRFAQWSRRYVRRIAIGDALVGLLAVLAPLIFSETLTGWMAGSLGILGALVWPMAVGLARGYEPTRVGVGTDEMRAVLRGGAGLVLAGAFPAGLLDETALLKLVVSAVPLAVTLSLTVRYLSRKRLHSQQREGSNVRRVALVGSAAGVLQLSEQLAAEPQCGMRVVGACLPATDADTAADLGVPILGNLDQVAQVVRDFGCDAVAVTSGDATRQHYLRRLSWSLEGADVELLVDPGLMEVAGPRMHIRPLVGLNLLHVEQPQFTGSRRLVKRAADVTLTSAGLLLMAPVLALIAAAVKFQDGGPVIFRQIRVGRDGQPFAMLKFRSMVVDAEARQTALLERNEGHGGLFKLSHDPRITRLGQFLRNYSLDELPQLFNVLAGSMSLVGPRPHLEHEIAAMHTDAVRRSLVTPGLTGLWQISGRSDLRAEDAIRLDLRYVENWSFSLDLLILWKTAFAVVHKRGAR